jgi:hypothetical protein
VGLLKHVNVTISEKEAEEMIRTADARGPRPRRIRRARPRASS